jgi:hypothetical protein
MPLFSGNHNAAFLKYAKEEANRGNMTLNNVIKNDDYAKKLEHWNMDGGVGQYRYMDGRFL